MYHSKNEDMEWEDSDLRTWLNSDFMEQAFSYPEYCQLRYGTLENGLYNQVFVLSQKEVERFFPTEEERICLPTKYAIKKGAYVNKTTGGSWWFLRTPGNDPACVMSVNSDGVMDYDGGKVTLKKGTVRPVIWVDKTVMAGNYHPLREHYNYASYTSPGITDITRSRLTTFNDAGIRTHMRVEENYENNIMNSNEFKYDDYGNITYIRYSQFVSGSDGPDTHIYIYENTYDKAGRMIYRNDPCEGYDEESWTYDEYGNLLTYSYRGKLKETYTYARLSTASLSVD